MYSSENQERRATGSLSSSIMSRLAQRQAQQSSSSSSFSPQQEAQDLQSSSSLSQQQFQQQQQHQQQQQQQQVQQVQQVKQHPAHEPTSLSPLNSRLMSLSNFQPPLPDRSPRALLPSPEREEGGFHGRKNKGKCHLPTKEFTLTGLSAG